MLQFRFRLRTLLCVSLLVSVVLGWYASHRRVYQGEQRFIEQLSREHRQVAVLHQYETLLCATGLDGLVNRSPTNLATQFATHLCPRVFQRVTEVSLFGPFFDAEVLPIVAEFSHLKEFDCTSTEIPEHELDKFRQAYPHVAVPKRSDEPQVDDVDDDWRANDPFGDL